MCLPRAAGPCGGLLFGSLAVFMTATTLSDELSKVEQALARPTTLEFVDAPLDQVLDHIRGKTRVPMLFDIGALQNFGIPPDTPVTCRLKDISLDSALKLMLSDLGLKHAVCDDWLLITIPEIGETALTTKAYPVDDLVPSAAGDDARGSVGPYIELVQVILQTSDPATWADFGGPGAITVAPTGTGFALLVAQSSRTHREIESLLDALRQIERDVRQGKPKTSYAVGWDWQRRARIRELMNKPISFDVNEMPLDGFLEMIRQRSGLNVLLDRPCLEDVGIPTDTPVTAAVEDVPLEQALRSVLHDLGLMYKTQNEVIFVTTPEEDGERLETLIYPIDDLLSADRDATTESLIEAIQTHCRRSPLDYVIGPGGITAFRTRRARVLIVRQFISVHDQIVEFLRRIRAAAEMPAPQQTPLAAPDDGAGIWGARAMHCSDGEQRESGDGDEDDDVWNRKFINPYDESLQDDSPPDPFSPSESPSGRPRRWVERCWLPKRLELTATPASQNIRDDEAGIERALDEDVSLIAQDVPLAELAKTVSEQCRVRIRVDAAVKTIGDDRRPVPVSVIAHGVPLRHLLTYALNSSDLDWTIHDGALLISSEDQIDNNPDLHTTREYRVTDLATFRNAKGDRVLRTKPVDEAVAYACADVGRTVSYRIHHVDGQVIVALTGNYADHASVRSVLSQLRAAADPEGKPPVYRKPAQRSVNDEVGLHQLAMSPAGEANSAAAGRSGPAGPLPAASGTSPRAPPRGNARRD